VVHLIERGLFYGGGRRIGPSPETELQIFAYREMRNDLTTLGHNRQAAAGPPVRGHLRDIFSIKHQVSRSGWQQSGNHFESRRFSHAVPAHQADDFTVRNRERDIAENVAFAVIGVDLLQFQHGPFISWLAGSSKEHVSS
jgi:hypothetical protein